MPTRLPRQAGEGPEPCNTGPSKCNEPSNDHKPGFDPAQVRVVAYGVDALYTTYDGPVHDWLLTVLKSLKEQAQAEDAPVPFHDLPFFGEPLVVHASGGVRGYRYHLSNSRVHIFVDGAGENQPALWLQPTAEFLHEVGARALVDRQRRDVAAFFMAEPEERANRLDLHVDLAGISFDAFKLRLNDGRMEIQNATCRAKDIQTVSRHGRLTGLNVGKRTGSTYLRIYDKTAELAKDGHLAALAEGEHTHYLLEIWKRNGWKGQTGVDKKGKAQFEQTLRIEFELGRELLKQVRKWVKDGQFCDNWDSVLELLDSIWAYCVLRWFVMREPGTASQKTRWARAAWWEKLADLKMLEGPQAIGARVLQKSTQQRKLAQLAAGVAVGLGALNGLNQSEAIHRLVAVVQSEFANRP